MSAAAPQNSAAASASRSLKNWFFRVVPAFDSLRSYTWHDLSCDTMAGLTVAAVAVPQAMAYAQIAGIPPQYGLYTAIVMTAVGALLDSSKQLINGPTNAISIAVLSALVGFSDAERHSGRNPAGAHGRRDPNRHLAAAARRPDALCFARCHCRLHAGRRSAAGARSAQKLAGACPRSARVKTIFSSDFG